MFTISRTRLIKAFLLVSLTVLACSLPGLPQPPAAEAPPSRGPGSFDLADPAIGLAQLTSYRATLQRQFEGTADGQPSPWSDTWSLAVSREPKVRLLTLEASGLPSDQSLSGLITGEIGGVQYSRQGPEDACLATVIEADSPPLQVPELAGLLPPVFGAEQTGPAETLAGVSVNHYTFDERALGAQGLAKVTGEIWVAAEGGFVVKYVLQAEGGPDYFGEGVEGTLTWEYQLAEVNQPSAVEPPAGCPPGLIEVPLLPDATEVNKQPGLTAYTTAASVAEVAAFYQEQMSAAGWELDGEPAISDEMAVLGFKQADRHLVVYITRNSTTEVVIFLETPETAAPTPLAPFPMPTFPFPMPTFPTP